MHVIAYHIHLLLCLLISYPPYSVRTESSRRRAQVPRGQLMCINGGLVCLAQNLFLVQLTHNQAVRTQPIIPPLFRRLWLFGQTINDHSRPMGDRNEFPGYLPADPSRFRVASVVPDEFERWRRRCPGISPISPGGAIDGVYPTLGVDRALAVRGAARLR